MGAAASGTTTAEERDGLAGTGGGAPPRPARPRLPRRPALLLGAAAVALVAGFGVWAFYGSAWLRVERVEVSGTRVLSEEQVRTAAGVPLGEPMASVDRSAVADRLTRRLRRVDSVEVVRDWPGAVVLEVTERRPEVVMEKTGDSGKFVEVDARGVRYATVVKRPAGVPLLVVERDRTAGDRHFGPGTLRAEAVKVSSALPPRVRSATETIRVRSFDSVMLELSGGRTVMWGSSEYGAAKARSLRALMKARGKAGHFDVSVPSAPAASGG
ncbi:FtsQ-type POTRA domain-containing protein [Streptomyces sp. 549]|uniref:cell division protein FtsQ/DivIB n=1 Tax=Streptomyces sp. 549 TaxID=3049076 RepID=UPI0024C22F8F|nr:FtsQ-type POTRA domain-containing protein [Streptomyces sp. 549]MDK1475597.1 FtsQ-type POTRA domain-containing protein [Streptomyces sp. 549]